ncbi:FabG Dehydrogenases with different specificities (related to short-chain alcohol dehydrogenases) [Acidimicrobiia bacterium]
MDPQKLSALFDLSGRTAIVTGGTRGIGRAIAEGFISAGANVVVASRKADACAETETHLNALAVSAVDRGNRALGVATHMGEIEALNALVAATVARFGGVDIVVNNAATGLTMPIGEFTPEAWDKQFEVNLRGPIFLIQAALPYLEKSEHASVVNVISAGAFLGSPNVAMYGAAKAALMSFTRSMGSGLASKKIRVNALAPGTVDTDMVRANTPEAQASMAAASPMKRAAHPDEMVGPALLLASDAGSFMTGQVILADGGMVPH